MPSPAGTRVGQERDVVSKRRTRNTRRSRVYAGDVTDSMCGGRPCAWRYVDRRGHQRAACASVTTDVLFVGGVLSAGDVWELHPGLGGRRHDQYISTYTWCWIAACGISYGKDELVLTPRRHQEDLVYACSVGRRSYPAHARARGGHELSFMEPQEKRLPDVVRSARVSKHAPGRHTTKSSAIPTIRCPRPPRAALPKTRV